MLVENPYPSYRLDDRHCASDTYKRARPLDTSSNSFLTAGNTSSAPTAPRKFTFAGKPALAHRPTTRPARPVHWPSPLATRLFPAEPSNPPTTLPSDHPPQETAAPRKQETYVIPSHCQRQSQGPAHKDTRCMSISTREWTKRRLISLMGPERAGHEDNSVLVCEKPETTEDHFLHEEPSLPSEFRVRCRQ